MSIRYKFLVLFFSSLAFKANLNAQGCVAIRRERPQSYPDILKTNDTKVFSRGDAAFADYSISLGFGYRF